MIADPGLDAQELTGALRAGYGIEATAFTFVPGYDMAAASYAVAATDGRWFAKIRLGPFVEGTLDVPRALVDAGVPNIPPPMRTLNSTLFHPMAEDRAIVLYPFVSGRNVMVAGMPEEGWRAFGGALRAVHDRGLAAVDHFVDRLASENFALPSAGKVRDALELAHRPPVVSAPGAQLTSWLEVHRGRIEFMIERAEALGARLRARSLPRVLCHTDIHAANILVSDDGQIFLVDWDGPMRAPRERDLLFVIGSRIAREVLPNEEAWFFEGYGAVEVDPESIIYYRYERILEDIGEVGHSVLADPAVPEAARAEQAALAERFFAPGGIGERIEEVDLGRV